MSTIYRCKVTVKHPASSQRVPSEFVDWYEYPTLEEAKEVHDENMHRYGLSGEQCETVWTLCDAETLKPLEEISVSKLFPSGALEVSAIVDGSLCRKTYFDYTAEEAIADFRSEHSI